MYKPKHNPPLVWLVCGGPSPEAAVSLSSGLNAAMAIDQKAFQVVPVCVRKDSQWWFARGPLGSDKLNVQISDLFESFEQDEADDLMIPLDAANLGKQIINAAPDCVLNLIHGEMGEDGVLQGMLEALRIPYTGSGVLASALSMDKILCQKLLAQEKIPIPPNLALRVEPENQDALVNEIEEELGYPVFVKPSGGGSSIGIRSASNRDELLEALENARFYDVNVLVEKKIEGMELTCAVMDLVDGGTVKTVAFPPTEIVPNGAEFFDYTAKYTPGNTEEITPARLADDALGQIRATAMRAHAAVGCEGMSRIDMFYSDGELFVIEINSVPGMTQTSLLPQGAKAYGVSFPEVLEHLIRYSWWRFG